MKPSTCPYLGLEDDPTTALGYPSEGNYCHHTRPVAPVNFDQQERYCLNQGHINCPVYQRANLAPLPADMLAPANNHVRFRQAAAAVFGLLLILALITMTQMVPGMSDWLTARFGQIPQTGGAGNSDLTNDARFFLLESTLTPLQPETATFTPLPLKENCPLPEGWVPYIVHPTDSLFRLSVVYSVSVNLLQRVNCMENSTAILPGQVLYIPFVPTRTPLPTNSPRQQIAVATTNTLGTQDQPPSQPAASPTNPVSVPVVPTPVPTDTHTLPATATLVPTPAITSTYTVDPTNTPAPSSTIVPTLTTTHTVAPTNTPNPTATIAPSNTPIPSTKPTKSRSPTKTMAATSTATDVPAPTGTPVPTDTPQQPTTTVASTDPPPPPTATIAPADPPTATLAPTDPPPPPTATIAPADPPTATLAPTDPPPPPTATVASTDPPLASTATVAPTDPTPPPTAAPTDPPPQPTTTTAPSDPTPTTVQQATATQDPGQVATTYP